MDNSIIRLILETSCQHIEIYKVGQEVYHSLPRGVDPKPYKIKEVLGDEQYKLERNGVCDDKIYKGEDLQPEP